MAAFLAGLTMLFYWKILFTNHFMFPNDQAYFFYPVFSYVHEQLRHFRLPLWDPYVMSGFPIIGDLEAQIFYPVNWLFELLHPFGELPYKMVEGQLILHYFLGGLFMYYLARSFDAGKAAALCGAVLFSFGGAMVVHAQHLASVDAVAWYPLIFLLARRGLIEGKTYLTVLAGVVFVIHILAGHWQHPVYFGLFLFLYFAYQACAGPVRAHIWPRWIYSLAIIGGIGAALAMVQILPSRELGNLSARSYITYTDITAGNDRHFLLTLFLPNFYGGLNGVREHLPLFFNLAFLTVSGCLLALLGLIETLRRRDFFWLGMMLLLAELSLGANGFLGNVIYHTPILNLFRNAGAFWDVGNFVLCLLAALGAQALFSKNNVALWKKYLPCTLTILLLAAATAGWKLGFGESIPGWYHMLAVLAVVSVLVTALLRDRLSPVAAQWSLLGLIVFQLCDYGMNQTGINAFPEDPRRFISRDSFGVTRDALRFLRADRANDFRIAAIAGGDWAGNGPNMWHISSIYGWNPLVLRRYQDYIRAFTLTGVSVDAVGGGEQRFDSSMLDLLGTKYIAVIDPEYKEQLQQQSGKFEKAFTDRYDWIQVFRNKNYLRKVNFYPRAYRVASEDDAIAAMKSRWFDGGRRLIFEKSDLPAELSSLTEELSVLTLEPKDIAASSKGSVAVEANCDKPLPIFGFWGEQKDDWLRVEVPGPAQPERYLAVIQYTAARHPTPSLVVEVRNNTYHQRAGPTGLSATTDWQCSHARTAELGTFELRTGTNQITIRAEDPAEIQIYSISLLRQPSEIPPSGAAFSFSHFSATANHIAFDTQQDRAGFVLLNEVYYPGWDATVDGAPARILQGDGIFRALYMPAGFHKVEMLFRPQSFAWGASISLLTLAGLLLYIRAQRRAHDGDRGEPAEGQSASRA